MTIAHLTEERCSKHPFEFDSIEGSGVFSCSFERVLVRVEISRLTNDITTRRRRSTAEGFDFLKLSAYLIDGSES